MSRFSIGFCAATLCLNVLFTYTYLDMRAQRDSLYRGYMTLLSTHEKDKDRFAKYEEDVDSSVKRVKICEDTKLYYLKTAVDVAERAKRLCPVFDSDKE